MNFDWYWLALALDDERGGQFYCAPLSEVGRLEVQAMAVIDRAWWV